LLVENKKNITGGTKMKFSEHLEQIEKIVEKEGYEKKKKETFNTTGESADELYIKSCGVEG
jgi:hypothetical protein